MKKATRKTKLIVGGFAVSIIVLACIILFMSGDDMSLFKKKSEYFATIQDASGLQAGASVQMSGVPVGNVESVEIASDKNNLEVTARLRIFSPHDQRIKTDSLVQIKTQGVLGDKYLTIIEGSPDAPVLPPGSFLESKPNLEIASAISKSAEIVDETATAAANLKDFTSGLPKQEDMKLIVTDLQQSVGAMRNLIQDLNAENSALRQLTDKETSKTLRATLDNLHQSSVHLESALKKIDEGQGTIGALINDPSLYDDLKSLMGRANRSKVAKFVIRKALEDSDKKKDKL